MSGRPRALILVSVLAACAAVSPAPGKGVAWTWRDGDEDHGGYSAIEIMPGGHEGIVLSDRGRLVRVEFQRNDAGRIIGLDHDGGTMLIPFESHGIDSEGLAIASGGQFYVSVEESTRVVKYDSPAAKPRTLPVPEAFTGTWTNRGLEGLAIDDDGALWTLFEEVSGDTLPTYVFRDDAWKDGPDLPRRGDLVPVGLDFDDEGRLYLLERQLAGVLGFRSRVRRFTFANDEVAFEEELLATSPGVHDNLEGIAVWRDDTARLRLTMISDDNFFFLQRTEFVEYPVPD